MKKNLLFLLLFIIFIGLVIYISTFTSAKINNDSYDKNAWKNYAEKIGIDETDDGWVYYFLINTINNGKTTKNFYQGCSLKYSELENYNITYEDGDKTFMIKTHPSLAVSNISKNGIKEKDEILVIDDFFDNKNFNRKITETDINDLKLNNFSKKHVVKMFNLAFSDEFTKEDSLLHGSKECSIITDELQDGYKINIGYLFQKRGLMAIRIDIIYEDGSYLLDLIKDNKASTIQKSLYNNLKDIEKNIINNQNFDCLKNYNGNVYERLYKGLSEEFK